MEPPPDEVAEDEDDDEDISGPRLSFNVDSCTSTGSNMGKEEKVFGRSGVEEEEEKFIFLICFKCFQANAEKSIEHLSFRYYKS